MATTFMAHIAMAGGTVMPTLGARGARLVTKTRLLALRTIVAGAFTLRTILTEGAILAGRGAVFTRGARLGDGVTLLTEGMLGTHGAIITRRTPFKRTALRPIAFKRTALRPVAIETTRTTTVLAAAILTATVFERTAPCRAARRAITLRASAVGAPSRTATLRPVA